MPRRLEPITDPFGGARHAAAKEWMESRPDNIKALAAEYPMGSVITDHEGKDWYVIGWGETEPCEHGQHGAVIISPIWPDQGSYDAAMKARQYIHAHHIADGEATIRKA